MTEVVQVTGICFRSESFLSCDSLHVQGSGGAEGYGI